MARDIIEVEADLQRTTEHVLGPDNEIGHVVGFLTVPLNVEELADLLSIVGQGKVKLAVSRAEIAEEDEEDEEDEDEPPRPKKKRKGSL